MMQNFVIDGLLPGGRCFNAVMKKPLSLYLLKQWIYTHIVQILPCHYYFTHHGKCLNDDDEVVTSENEPFVILRAHFLLPGGKGGFGTLIRAMGTQANKNSRKGACRDLSGRRMRDVDAEKRIAKWMAGESQRKEKQREEKDRKLEQRRREPRHCYTDSSYTEQIYSTEENIDMALQQGIQAASSSTTTGTKRRSDTYGDIASKKSKIWIGVDDFSDELSDSDLDEDVDAVPKKEMKDEDSLKKELLDTKELKPRKDIEPTKELTDTELRKELTDIDSGCAATEFAEFSSSNMSNREINSYKESPELLLKVIALEEYDSVEELLTAGGTSLKYTLQSMGLKCGGTVLERAKRLFSVKGKTLKEIDPSLLAKGCKLKIKNQE